MYPKVEIRNCCKRLWIPPRKWFLQSLVILVHMCWSIWESRQMLPMTIRLVNGSMTLILIGKNADAAKRTATLPTVLAIGS